MSLPLVALYTLLLGQSTEPMSWARISSPTSPAVPLAMLLEVLPPPEAVGSWLPAPVWKTVGNICEPGRSWKSGWRFEAGDRRQDGCVAMGELI